MSNYQYRMVQIAPTVLSKGTSQDQAAANYLQQIVNENARDGWEFYRIDQFSVAVNGCCLLAFMGTSPNSTTVYYVVTFRKAIG